MNLFGLVPRQIKWRFLFLLVPRECTGNGAQETGRVKHHVLPNSVFP